MNTGTKWKKDMSQKTMRSMNHVYGMTGQL